MLLNIWEVLNLKESILRNNHDDYIPDFMSNFLGSNGEFWLARRADRTCTFSGSWLHPPSECGRSASWSLHQWGQGCCPQIADTPYPPLPTLSTEIKKVKIPGLKMEATKLDLILIKCLCTNQQTLKRFSNFGTLSSINQ